MAEIILKGKYLSYLLYHVDEIPSTNTYLKENGSSYPSDSVLDADFQTQGRGRGSHSWKSDSDITFSVLKKENLPYDFIVPLAVRHALADFGIPALIKWPNDIYADMRKISGILTERVFSGTAHLYAVIGIGINMSPKEEYGACGIRDYATCQKEEVILRVLHYLSFYAEKAREELLAEYKSYNLVYGKRILHNGTEYTVIGFDDEGALVVLDKNDGRSIIRSDEISIKESMIDHDRYFKG